MRNTNPRQNDEAFAGDSWVAGPIIILPPDKDAPIALAPAPAHRSVRRERLTRAGFALGGGVITLALTLVAVEVADRNPSDQRSDAARVERAPMTAMRLVVAREAEAAPAATPAPDSAPTTAPPSPSVPERVRVPAVLVMATSPALSPSTTDVGPLVVAPAGALLAAPAVLLSSTIAIDAGPSSLTGEWYHIDARAQNADSLMVTLNADGSAAAFERRWSIRDRGWHAETIERRGWWEEEEPDRTNREVCVTWTSPGDGEACAKFFVDRGAMRMHFGGRYWRRAVCVEQSPVAGAARAIGTNVSRAATP